MSIWIIIGIIGAIVIFIISAYNSLVSLRVKFKGAWSDIEVFLKKRHELIPNLVNVAKGYAKHEKETLEQVIQARNQAVSANSTSEQLKSESLISGMIPRIFALAEQYPDLKASESFQDISKNLSQIEAEISNARRYYNAVVRDYNTKQQVFPSNLIASSFSFELAPFFNVDEKETAVPKVKF